MFARLRKPLKLLGLSVPLFYYNDFRNRMHCCGIIGVMTVNNNAHQIIMEGMHLLENRGYDSAGMATTRKNDNGKYEVQTNNQYQLQTTKYASDPITNKDCFQRIEQELDNHLNAFSGIGHTRWATCGAKLDRNAHPHLDMRGRVALVHNGTLENYVELKEQLLQKHSVTFSSDTDSEVIAQWIGLHLSEGQPLLEAVENTLLQLKGQWGLVVMDRESPGQMVVCRQGSPILVGYNNDSIYVASEKIAFEKYTQNFMALKDGEVMLLKLDERQSFFNQIKHRLQIIEKSDYKIESKPREPYRFFFEQEVFEQPQSALRCLGNGSRLAGSNETPKLGGLEQQEDLVLSIKNLVLLGCGSSFYAAQAVLPLFKALNIFETVQLIEASEFTLNDLPKSNPGVIVISQSGETKDLLRALEESQKLGVISIGVINVVGSLLATQVDCGIYINCGREVAVAASKSFTCQVIALLLVATWLSYHKEKKTPHQLSKVHLRQKTIEQLRALPISIGQCLEQSRNEIKRVAEVLSKHQHLLILGKGPCAAIAKEGALKIKELTYIHAEGFSAGELKYQTNSKPRHGPLALIDSSVKNSTPVILLILENEFFHDMMLALSEVHSRNAETIVITDVPQKVQKSADKIGHMITIPYLGHEIGWLLAVYPLQLIALEICVILNRNPDKPRNLAKTVTVG